MEPKKKSVTRWNRLKLIGVSSILLCFVTTIIVMKIKTEDNIVSRDNVIATFENNGEFIFQTSEKNKTIIFSLKNESDIKKNYNLKLQSVTNSLNDFSKLTYDLWINENQEVANEIFPNREMLLLDGAEIDAHKNLDFKLMIKYESNDRQSAQSVRGKLTIEDTKH